MGTVELRNVSKTFASHQALSDVSISVDHGEVVAFIGPSGGGKSTLLRCINYLESPTSGEIFIDGRPSCSDPRKPSRAELLNLRRRVGMVFQSFNLFPHLTVLRNITLAQELTLRRDRREAEERALMLLERVGLRTKAHSKPTSCSGGQQQRIAIARALALDPEILLFDEPTSALDPEVSVEVLDVMKELAQAGTTMLVVTHEMGFARHVAQRVAVLDEGRILECGPSHELFEEPANDRTRRFLAAVMDR